MIAIICGGRDYAFTPADCKLLNALPLSAVFHGGARGADAQADAYAAGRGIVIVETPADWERYGRGAGPIRNGVMLRAALGHCIHAKELLIVVAFPGGAGTANMVLRARRAGVPVLSAGSRS